MWQIFPIKQKFDTRPWQLFLDGPKFSIWSILGIFLTVFKSIFNFCFKPKEEPTRKILTISTLQLHRAINDRIQDEMDQVYIQEPSKESVRSSMPEDFPFDKPRKKFVGGGGVIAKYENPFRY